jgi:sulfur-carrier protein
MIKVRIPTPLRPLTGGKGEVEMQASDIQSLIESLNDQYPGVKDRMCDDTGEVRRFVNIYLNEEDIRFLNGKATALKDGDEVSIVPAIAGGAPGRNKPSHLRFHLRFPEEKIKEPVLCRINREYPMVETNIRRADVREKTGWMDVEFIGEAGEIENAIDGVRKKGIIVDPIELNVVE